MVQRRMNRGATTEHRRLAAAAAAVGERQRADNGCLSLCARAVHARCGGRWRLAGAPERRRNRVEAQRTRSPAAPVRSSQRRRTAAETKTLATLRTMADIVGGCTEGNARTCRRLFFAASPPGRPRSPRIRCRPCLTSHAIPRTTRPGCSRCQRRTPTAPAEHRAERVGAVAQIHRGWIQRARADGVRFARQRVGDQQLPAARSRYRGGLGLISLSPTGRPINGSPVEGGGLEGVWWGIAIDQRDHVWTSNYTGADTTPFTSRSSPAERTCPNSLTTAPRVAFRGVHGRRHQRASGNRGRPTGQRLDRQPRRKQRHRVSARRSRAARVITGGGLSKPFAIAIDARGNKWVTDNAISNTLRAR